MAMDVVQFLASLLELHRQQLQALSRQGEIQAEVLAQLLEGEGCGAELRLPSLGREEQNPEAYLSVFEQAAASCRLPRQQWGARLAGLLSQEMWAESYPTMSPSSAAPDYEALREGILRRAREAEEQGRLDFLSVRYDPLRGARDLGRRLDSAARRWLCPERRTAAQVEQKVALEQFVSLLPKEAGDWVHNQHPRDMEEAIRLAEQRLRPSNEEDPSPTSVTTATQTDMLEKDFEAGEAGQAKQQKNCNQTGVKENITESFLNKLDPVKLESVHFSLDIPELEVILLDDEGSEENPSVALKQEVTDADFSAPAVGSSQGPALCTQGPPEEEDRKWKVGIGSGALLSSAERVGSADSAGDHGVVSPLQLPQGYTGIGMTTISPPASPVPGPTLSDVSSTGTQLGPPLAPPPALTMPSGSSLSRYQDAMARGRLKERENMSWTPFLSKLGLKRGVTGRRNDSSHAPLSHDRLQRLQRPRPQASHAPAPAPTAPADRTHRCPDCGRSFTQVSSLQEHRNIHTGEKPFRCAQCGKAFHHRRTLNKHSRVHSGERPFHCAQCGWSFKLKDALKRHQLTHRRNKPANPNTFHSGSDLQQLYCDAT
ncbi:hypothetical protein AGOR_G00031450 [Albula goreensis]|uniref:Uncharacterized protein n=1 Tax=Albula goreensis TaxID=1534307 RepID=A0A8T3E2Z1_9TELE|nr:hypothetical protein AGOR_G00031450 [Albula goreensis]